MNTTNNKKLCVFKTASQHAAYSISNYIRSLSYTEADKPNDTAENFFMIGLSIAEYCEQANPEEYPHITAAVEDTITRSVKCWRFDEDYIIKLLLAVLAKAGEHSSMQLDRNAKSRAFPVKVHAQYAIYYDDRANSLYKFVMDELYNGDENKEIRAKILHALD